MSKKLLFRLAVLVAAIMSALGAAAAEAYANYIWADGTLTFYYDDLRDSRLGMTYDLKTGETEPGWRFNGNYTNVVSVIFDASFAGARPTSTYEWFSGMENLESITGLSYLNTSEVTDMAHMFNGCSSLTSLDVSHFNTSKVTDMRFMFKECSGLASLDLGSFNTSKVTNMYWMFFDCPSLRTIFVGSGWSTAAVTNSSGMFGYCTSLIGGKGTTYNENNVDAAYAHLDGGASNPGYFTATGTEAYACYTPSNTTLTFYYDTERSSRTGTTYDLNTGENNPIWYRNGTNAQVTKVVFNSSFASARPTSTHAWFYNMENLQSISSMSNLNTSEVTNMSWMFGACPNLNNLDLSNFNTSKVTNMDHMFYDCAGLTRLNLGSFNTSKVTNMNSMFLSCSNLQNIYVDEGWSTAAVTNSSYMFLHSTSLVGGKGTTYDASHVDAAYAHYDGGPSNPGYFTAVGAEAYACYTSSDSTLTFYYDTLRGMRQGTKYSMPSITTLTPAWYSDGTYDNVTNVVFEPSFAGYRPTYTYGWFRSMRKLRNITGMSYLKTDKVLDMRYMFQSCSKLTSLDVSHFNTSRATNMNAMFDACSGLASLDLSSFNTSNVTNMARMFTACLNLTAIYVGEGWSTAAVTNSTDMFLNCKNLVGDKGTTYDANHVDKAYAHLDGGPSNPGYFTDKGTEAYVCYTTWNTTLTFYYDNMRSSRSGIKYDLNTGNNDPDWRTTGVLTNVTRVVFDPSFANARPRTTYCWFLGMQNVQYITGMNYLNTSMVTNMSYMFCRCTGLTSLDLSHFNTSNVSRMYNMFSYCSRLTNLDLSSFNTSKVTDMAEMLRLCSDLQTITVGSDWSTAAVTNSTNMFGSCTSLVGGMGTTYNDSNPKDKTYAHIDGGASNPGYFTAAGTEAYACYTPENTTLTFYYDTERSSRTGTTYDLNTGEHDTGWKTDGTNASVTRVIFDPSFAGARPTTTYLWFYLMRNLQTITGIEYLNTSEVTNMAHMFNTCSSLTNIDISGFNTSKVTEMRVMFCNCTGLTSLDLSSFNTSNVTNMFNMFGDCSGLTSLDLSSFNTSNVTDMGRMFYGCSRLATVYVGENWSTEAVTSSSYMFHNNNNLMGGQGTTYNGSNPKDKTYAHIDGGASNPGYFTATGIEAYACYTPSNTTLTFYYDTERSTRPGTTYDLNTGMNTPAWRSVGSHVTQVVFDPSFANARLTTTYSWFYGMQNLQTIEGMEYLNTSEVTDIAYMFGWCTSLTSLDLSHFNTSKVTNMGYMFYYCESLTSLDLSSFITSMVTNTGFMFYGCSNLRTIYASEGWSTEAVTNSTQMFNSCTSLVGGQGTTWNDSNPKDKAYAHIDGGTSNPGYFTAKSAGLRGDVNGDGSVNISDVTALINYLLNGNASEINLSGADANQDSSVNISDATAIINYVLNGTWN